MVRLICTAMAEMLVRIPAAEPEVPRRERGPEEAVPEAASFDDLVVAHQRRVARLCYRLLGWRGDVEDVAQEVFLAAFKAWPRFRGESRVSTWLTRIAVNACRSHLRRRRPRLRLFAKEQSVAEPYLERPPDGELIDRERFEQVWAAVRGLPAKYREPVVLRYLEKLAVAEIGDVLGLSKNAVEVRLNRARKWLKDDLAGIVEG